MLLRNEISGLLKSCRRNLQTPPSEPYANQAARADAPRHRGCQDLVTGSILRFLLLYGSH